MNSDARGASLIRALGRVFRRHPLLPDGIQIGRDVFIGNDVSFDWVHGHLITVGDEATVADGVRILCHDAASNRRTGGTWVAPVSIGTRAYLGSDSLVLPGVTIGEDSVVAAGAVVTKDVDPGSVVAGVPAVEIARTADIDSRRVEMMKRKPVLDATRFARARLSSDDTQTSRELAETHGGYFVSDSAKSRSGE